MRRPDSALSPVNITRRLIRADLALADEIVQADASERVQADRDRDKENRQRRDTSPIEQGEHAHQRNSGDGVPPFACQEAGGRLVSASGGVGIRRHPSPSAARPSTSIPPSRWRSR